AAGSSTIATAAHPGGARTNLGNENPGGVVNTVAHVLHPLINQVMQPAAMGALPTMRAAVDPAAAGGEYYGPDGIGEQRGYAKRVESTKRSKDLETARRLWTMSEELSGVRYTALD
ncbi:MAG: short-chain dehydrogenase, partial [Acidimicrobiia bacterium]